MSRRGVYLRRALVAVLLLSTVLIFSGCANVVASAQNTLAPEGTVAGRQRDLFLLVIWPGAAILILVEFLVVYIVFRFRQRKGDDSIPRQVHGNPALEVAWTVAPALLLAIIAVPTLAGVVALGREPKADAVKVQVTGSQWIWQFAYPDYKDSSGNPVSSPPNELHIPEQHEIGLQLHSTDVIHSFWVPKLAGKTDVIPNHPNHMWIKADHTGDYSGQCAEFCGFGHATMRFRVIVQSQADFDAWIISQGATSGPGIPTAATNATPSTAAATATPAGAQTSTAGSATAPSQAATSTRAPAATATSAGGVLSQAGGN